MVSIPVTYNGEEILMSGLTSRTTCGDVIYALLIAEGTVNGHEWALFEKWKDVERRLPDRTKITKIWKSWRFEQQNVQFVLQKSDIGSINKHKSSKSGRKQKNLKVLEEYTVQELTMQIMEQQKVITEQVYRMGVLDREIEQHETDLHHRRAHEEGSDYVQQAYEFDKKCPDLADLTITERTQYMEWCEKILELGEKLLNEEQKIQDLSLELSSIEIEEATDIPVSAKQRSTKDKHVSFSLTDNIRCLSPVEFEIPDSECSEVFESDVPCSGQYNVASGVSRLYYDNHHVTSGTHSDVSGTRLDSSITDGAHFPEEGDPWGTYVVLQKGSALQTLPRITKSDDSFDNNESESSGIGSDPDQSPKDSSDGHFGSSFDNDGDLKMRNRKACERWCQQIGAYYHPGMDFNNNNTKFATVARLQNVPSYAIACSYNKKVPAALDIQTPSSDDVREDSYLSCPSPSDIRVLEELNVGQKFKGQGISDNDSDTGLSSMHSSELSVLETLV